MRKNKQFVLSYDWNNIVLNSLRDRTMCGFSEKITKQRINTLFAHELSRLKGFLELEQIKIKHR